MIGKAFAKGVAKKTTGIVARKAASVADDVAEEVVEEPVKKALVASKTPSKTTKAAEPTPTPAEEPMPVFGSALSEEDRALLNETMLAKQTEEALPAPTSTPESPYNFPNKAFTDDEYAAAEQYLKDNSSAPVFNAKKMNKEEFANELQTIVSMQKGLKMKDSPPMPYAPKDYVPDEAVGADTFGASLRDVQDVIEPPKKIDVDAAILSGKLPTYIRTEARDRTLAQIRQHREDTYRKLVGMRETDTYDEQVLAVGQGDYRMQFGKEVDLASAKERKQFFKLLNQKQKEYDSIKEKYKDTPDITLYHGNTRDNVEAIRKGGGFAKPATSGFEGHSELLVNAPSMTRDLNLNFVSSRFGGQDAGNFLSYKMPYADYVFTRVNMPKAAYEKQNLDVVAQAISGVPGQPRALQLPRADYFETESAMPEADKMRLNMRPESDVGAKIDEFQKINDRRRKVGEEMKFLASESQKGITPKIANATYATTKDYLYTLSNMGKLTSVRTGIGQYYSTYFAGLGKYKKLFKDTATALREAKSEQKADNLEQLIDVIEQLQGDVPKAPEKALKLTDKFKDGGLVRRK
jgi:hypothetical protein